ncbi:hypothetical protein RMN56_28340 [Micromonospora halotolerans]|uniref:SMI1/KNR4 family protein n=1 Tax=Micromonospora halotolerans TaxID=709879 RepID=A0ABY9ZUY3_9ACTN|nr:hypothetical protein [Micromonospora halotolerans]WNM38999.1 hypothetical protein RMN56_28340 [Micromonospora halotolerans]
MDGAYIRRWREDVTACLDRLLPGFEVRLGYPPGRHMVGGMAGEERFASLASTRPSGDLLEWYRQVREVSLPDIGSGYFVHDPGLVVRREVASVRGRFTADVVVFASDGGGTLFAVSAVTGSPVYRLPAGEIVAGVYRSDDPRFDVVAEDLTGFLDRLHDAVEVFAATGAAGDL